jgi:hypothetical protein
MAKEPPRDSRRPTGEKMSRHAKRANSAAGLRHEPSAATLDATIPAPSKIVSEENDLAKTAYYRWLDRGCPDGTADEDWFEAERALRAGN